MSGESTLCSLFANNYFVNYVFASFFITTPCGLRICNESDTVLGIVMNYSINGPSLLAVLFLVFFSEHEEALFTRMYLINYFPHCVVLAAGKNCTGL